MFSLFIMAASTLAPPLDYCENFDQRLGFYNDYRAALQQSLDDAKPGQKLVFEVVEKADPETEALRYKETWILKSINKKTGAVKVEALRQATGAQDSKDLIDWQVKIGDAVDPKPALENCSHPYMYAYTFTRGQEKLAQGTVPTLTRQQFEIGNVKLVQTVSSKVPLGLVKEHMEVLNRKTGKVSSRDLKLVSYSSK
ncbi:MAG TPA: hypothetical protein VE954_18630 [Oligoflexus sp.]|uniref:hypothetical protein n=1 Tax=Oligoflexus sp. TaxID=1971216 RepID=UPI002D42AD47|nr:hypothetical protein [Oligoflexus sp.]HYX35117.1 hypothetical protein [Oligoflexus sp.]